MATTITFPNAKLYDASDQRPYADVSVANGSGVRISAIYKCLVDTGADYIVLPISAAAGLVLSGTMKNFRGVTGSKPMNFESGVQIMIETTYVITTDVLFDPSPTASFIPILGRTAILTAFDLGLDVSNWLW